MNKKNAILISFVACVALYANLSMADDGSGKVSGPEAWASSPHANAESEAFTHWDEDGKIPANCATCHSETGFHDYVGADGTNVGVVDNAAATGTVVSCDTCHNDAVKALDQLSFPSGAAVDSAGSSTACMVCHQGRASTVSVNKATENKDSDTVSDELQFINIHYRAAAATLLGTQVKGGYEYPGKTYTGKFAHVVPFDSCSGCHDAHTTEVKVSTCVGCHQSDVLTDIRISAADYDADGDVKEGVHAEIQSLHEALAQGIERYSQEVVNAPVLYHAHAYPYFFADNDADGSLSDAEAIYPNRYQQWTPRLLKAAYNYQFVAKDPGAYAHNPKYVLQLLHDSLDSLSEKVSMQHDFDRAE